jgi:hypothetical protein
VANQEDAEWRQVRGEAVAALDSVLGWNLTSTRWKQVSETLTDMAAAASAPAPAALAEAGETLGLYMPCVHRPSRRHARTAAAGARVSHRSR